MKKIYTILLLLLATFSVNARININEYLRGNPDLRGAFVGVLAVTAGGDTLACHNADVLFVPASNMKLVTVASALKYLGAEYRYETKLAASGEKPKTVRCSNKYPELTCAKEFYDYLLKSGLYAEGYDQGKAPADASILGTTFSSPLKGIIVPLLQESDNFLAETIFRTMGKELLDDDKYESSAKAETMILESVGATGLDDIVIRDGSGLSPNNLVSPAFLCQLLSIMLEQDSSGAFLNDLPIAGVNGTVASFLPDLPDKVRHRVHLKSGTLTGVKTYSGYYLPQNGSPVIFSVMLNNCKTSDQKLSSAAGEIISSIISRADR